MSGGHRAGGEDLRGALGASLAQVAALERQHAEAVEAVREAGGADDEHDPEGSTAFERAQLRALLARSRERSAELAAALEREEAGTRGTCARCGGPIAPERLAARPGATSCITCASRGG